MGELLNEIRNAPRLGTPKKIDLILGQLDEQDRADLIEALADHKISGTTIARVLRKKGFDCSRKTVQRYRGLYDEP